ncbi:uncharacterized protein LOC110028366 [Phalaenopsis equestris]|uniref:uncharacterized protein LOC110028366 n=1 Tax=Phalaenopsis equestris TaxID=78828 RepID=UPI0009E1AB70|nr:uncharacterized protein LOC110028366 [Phalaenopsis equestris]
MARTSRLILEDEYEAEQRKQAAADVLYQYSQFVMVCIGEGVRPTDLRLHLMKEISGMQTSLKKELLPSPSFPDSVGEPSSSGPDRDDRSKSSRSC